MSAILRLNFSDAAKGLVVAVIVVVLGALQQAFTSCGVDFNCFDWAGILDVGWKAAVAYLGKNLLTDSEGKLGGVLKI